MRKILLLLVIICCGHVIHARQTDHGYRKKLSPPLLRSLQNDRPSTWWIVTTDIGRFKKFLATKKMESQIKGEYPASGLMILHSSWPAIDSIILRSPLVIFADKPRKPKEELVINGFDKSVNAINTAHSSSPAINGAGLIVSLKENKPDTTDIDLKGRFLTTTLSPSTITSHATIMATIISGGGNSYYLGKGVAWSSTLSSSDFSPLLPDAVEAYQQYGISMQNHSYGTGIENYYGADAAAYDASAELLPSLLHVFSAGNSGNETSTSGPYTGIPGYANLTGSFKMAKNILTVGAINDHYVIESRSSRGPAYDGRIKPELVAYGQEGSSGAAAIVSGIGLLVQQAYRDQHAGQLPPSSLTKAVLINSATDLPPAGPDLLSGFGNANAYEAIQTVRQNRFFTNALDPNTTQQVPLQIPAGIKQLKITLCWTDPAAAANATKALVNDLDLVLVNHNGSRSWLPWVLNTTPDLPSLQQLPLRKKDTLNNIEQITITDPMAGNYSIRVGGSSLSGTNQVYAVAYQLDTADRFRWYSPVQDDYATGGEQQVIRWTSTFVASTGKLEYSVNEGIGWTEIASTVDLQQGYLVWTPPVLFTTALLRMTIGHQSFISDTFTISSRLSLQTGFNCEDSFLLSWNKIPGISGYTVYALGEYYLAPVSTGTDTSILLQKQAQPALHYAVAPVLASGKTGQKSYTINYTSQGVACYIKTFLADLQPPNTALITIQLGTLHAVRLLVIEKWNGNAYALLHTLQPNGLNYEFVDENLHRGQNTYRLRIELQRGDIIVSQPETVYYFQGSQFIVYPNPARRGGTLNILMNDPEKVMLQLYNSLGQPVFQRQGGNFTEQVSLEGLQPGVYFLMIRRDGKRIYTTSIVVQ